MRGIFQSFLLVSNVTFFLLLNNAIVFAQQTDWKKGADGGTFGLGVRSTVSLFNHGETENIGTGVGGQFRLQFAEKVNSDWFFDYLTSNVDELAHRSDYHIGWSVLYYPTTRPVKIRPYVLAGHCFDYTRITDNFDQNHFLERWSSAVQGGIGSHFNLSNRFDISMTAQYMIHLGNDIHAEQENGTTVFREEKGASLEGHLLVNVSLTYKIADLW